MKNPKFNRADQLMLGLKDRCQKLNAGEKFLSVRQIMEEFGVSQITVKQAIERLCESGVLEARDRSGYFVRRDRRYGRIVSILPGRKLRRPARVHPAAHAGGRRSRFRA